ncbi:MAG TPA: hypothetical protein VJC12_00150 [Candidatus Paceibacterota bacterium]
MDRFPKKERPNIESPEFLAEIREKIADRLSRLYPLEEVEKTDLPDKVRSGMKFPINSWVGDACASIANELYRMSAEEYDRLRKQLFID